jgi:hypothetical protein
VAAQYVEAELRAAGLEEVRLQPFTAQGIAGTKRPGRPATGNGPEFVVWARTTTPRPKHPARTTTAAGWAC